MKDVSPHLKLTCRSCGKQTPLKDLKYGPNRQDLHCSMCLQKTSPLPKVEQKIKRKINKEGYTCKKCNYKFSLKINSSTIIKCPYCGREDYLQKDGEFTTERILREVSERDV